MILINSQISHYTIQRVIGEGGMGLVYSALDKRDGSIVAIKELKKTIVADKELQLRFQQEAFALSLLSHPNIVAFNDYFEYNESLYLVMEYVDGKTFDDYIANMTGPIPEDIAKKYMSQILSAFSYAHERGIVHRDIKPQNIIVTTGHIIKIFDFGVAKILFGNSLLHTALGSKIGTVSYMSPEQVRGDNIDIRSDIYSLGVLLYQLVSGRPPYDVSLLSEYEIFLNVLQKPLPRIKEYYEYASDHIQKVIDHATNKQKELRYQNCNDFLLEINKIYNKKQSSSNRIKRSAITIGRDSGCDIVINNSENKVSRIHAEIKLFKSQYIYSDKSTNGSIVNGKKIFNEDVAVAYGDKIVLADSLVLSWDEICEKFCFENKNKNQLVLVYMNDIDYKYKIITLVIILFLLIIYVLL
jgi:serine/threonine protein kinase